MSSSSPGWQQVDRNGRPIRRMNNRQQQNLAQSPPAMNTRSHRDNNFRARRSPISTSDNRFIPSPLPPALNSPSMASRSSIPSTVQPSNEMQPQSPPSINHPTPQSHVPSSLPAPVPSPTTVQLLNQPPSQPMNQSNEPLVSGHSVHVSEASASQYTNPIATNQSQVTHQSALNLSQDFSNEKNVKNNGEEISTGSTADEQVDIGSLLDQPSMDNFARIYETFDRFEQFLKNETAQTRAEISSIHNDVKNLQVAANMLDSRIFGSTIGPSPGSSVPQQLHRVNPKPSPATEGTGLSYPSPPEHEHQQQDKSDKPLSSSYFHGNIPHEENVPDHHPHSFLDPRHHSSHSQQKFSNPTSTVTRTNFYQKEPQKTVQLQPVKDLHEGLVPSQVQQNLYFQTKPSVSHFQVPHMTQQKGGSDPVLPQKFTQSCVKSDPDPNQQFQRSSSHFTQQQQKPTIPIKPKVASPRLVGVGTYPSSYNDQQHIKNANFHHPTDRIKTAGTMDKGHKTSSWTKTPIFNSNPFYIIIADNAKIKYENIVSHFSKLKLKDDSYQSLEDLYIGIFTSIGIGLSATPSFVPKFASLDKNTSFFDVFLSNLHGLPFDRAFAVYEVLGQYIKTRLRSTDCISPNSAPLAYDVVHPLKNYDGWSLFEELIKERLVSCGATPDRDLFSELLLVQFQQGESLQNFYRRLQDMESEFEIMLQSQEQFVPRIKLLLRFVTELMRSPEYRSYLIDYHKDLLRYEKNYGNLIVSHPVPFTLTQIYKELRACKVSAVPRGRLLPSPNDMPIIQQPLQEEQSSRTAVSISNQQVTLPSISSQELPNYHDQFNDDFLIDSWYCHEVEQGQDATNPIIAAMQQRRTRKFCQACLTPGHDASMCFLRGPNFRPKELSQRLLIYNQQNGDSPPKGTVIPKWNPRTPPPLLKESNQASQPNQNKNKNNINTKKTGRPFGNSPHKAVATKPSVNALETNEHNQACDDNDYSQVEFDGSDQFHPSLSSFIANQEQVLTSLDTNFQHNLNHEEQNIVIAMMKTTPQSTSLHDKLSYSHNPDMMPNFSILDATPSQIHRQLQISHRRRIQAPSSEYFKQYSRNLHTLPSVNFHRACKLQFQVDSGANVFSVYSRELLIAFFPVKTNVENVNGTHFTSNGWGIALCEINNKQYLLAPVYECPENPRNTFSPGALKKYSAFQKAIVDCHNEVILTDHNGVSFTKPIVENNGLDFIEIQLLAFSSSMIVDPKNNAYSLLSFGHDNNGNYTSSISRLNLPDLTNSNALRFNKTIMNKIAYFFVLIHQDATLRQQAILTMNQLNHPTIHCNYFRPLPQAEPSQTCLPTVSAFEHLTSDHDTTIVPMMHKMYKRVTRVPKETALTYMMLHLLFQHASKEQILLMAKKKCFEDMPDISAASKIICQCSICNLAKARRLPRGKLVDKTLLDPMKRLHLDFSFYTITSLRGYTTCLTIVCAATSYPFTFPTKSKTSPLRLVKWFINAIRGTGREVVFIRVDEDGALANCSHFCELIIQLNCILETTGGYNSENNGMVEQPHGTLADMMRASLLNAKHLFGDQLPQNLKIQQFWCFALQHCSYTLRRKYNRMRDNTPYFLVHGKRPSIKQLAIFGSRVTIMNPKKEKMKKLSMDRSEFGHFLSFGNSVNNILYWKSRTPMDYHRAHHAVIDDVWTLNKLKNQFTVLPTSNQNNDLEKVNEKEFIDLVPLQEGPFSSQDIRVCTFQVPPIGTKIGMCLQDDPIYNLPFIKVTHPGTVAYDGIPSTYRQNSFILNINKEGPLNTAFAQDMLKKIQASESRILTLDLVKRPSEAKQTSLSISRAMFDQMPDLSQRGPVISTMEPVIPDSHAHFITSATKPNHPGDNIFKLFKGPQRRNWIAACKMSYHKNRQVAVFAQPIPRRQLPPETKVFPTKLVPEYKPTDVPTVYECKVRDCTVGTGQEKGIDFPESYCATIDPVTWKLVLCITVVIRNFCAIMDVKNAFQTSIAPPEYRIFVTCPPFYLEWLTDSEGFTFEQGVQYVRQMLNGNQGTKPASHLWYKLLKPILEKYGFAKSTVDHAFFVKVYEGPRYFYICLATDDLLCSFPTWAIFEDFKQFMEKHFKLTIQTGKILRFLGMRIIQTEQGISVDQAEYLYDLVFNHYGREIENLKIAPTPSRYDAKFEKDLYESKPLSPQLLKEYSLKYKGGFRYHTGKFNYAACHTRGDIVYATQRIAEYNSSPTAEAFESIGRMYRYLAGDMLRPLFFPSGSLADKCNLTYFDGEKDIDPIAISNELQLYSDAELARNLADRKSYLCNVVTLMNVCILIKVQKSTTIMTHTTDSETKATFSGIRRLIPIQRLLEFMGFPCSSPTPGHMDNAALEAIISSQRMTPRSRHLDIPIAYLQEHNGSTYVPKLIRTYYMLADIGTKPLSVHLHRRLKYWLMGAQFYPVPDTEHFNLLEMQLYEQSYVVIVRQYTG